MKKKIKNLLIILFLFFIVKENFNHSELIMQTVNDSINIWINNIFPSLFPFMIISDLLINYGFIDFISKLLNPLFKHIFKLKKEGTYVFIMSLLSGSPNNATLLKELYKQNRINNHDITKIIMFSHFSNPLFILGTVSTLFLMNKKAGIYIFISQIISNILIGIIFRNKFIKQNKTNFQIINNRTNLITLLQNSIIKNINILLLILGILTICMLLTTIINENIHLSPISNCLLKGGIELTQGLKCISLLSLNINIKATIMSSLISFGGISIHLQIRSILNDTPFKYVYFLFARILQAILSGIITYILLI